MTDYIVELAPEAEQDIASAFAWYEEYSVVSAENWRAKIFEAIDYVGRSPLRQKSDDEGNRFWRVAKTRHSIVYEVNDSTVTVLAVAHHRRDPDYWRNERE